MNVKMITLHAIPSANVHPTIMTVTEKPRGAPASRVSTLHACYYYIYISKMYWHLSNMNVQRKCNRFRVMSLKENKRFYTSRVFPFEMRLIFTPLVRILVIHWLSRICSPFPENKYKTIFNKKQTHIFTIHAKYRDIRKLCVCLFLKKSNNSCTRHACTDIIYSEILFLRWYMATVNTYKVVPSRSYLFKSLGLRPVTVRNWILHIVHQAARKERN